MNAREIADTLDPGDVRFLDLIRNIAAQGYSVRPGWLARALGKEEVDVEAALVHLKERGDIRFLKRKRR